MKLRIRYAQSFCQVFVNSLHVKAMGALEISDDEEAADKDEVVDHSVIGEDSIFTAAMRQEVTNYYDRIQRCSTREVIEHVIVLFKLKLTGDGRHHDFFNAIRNRLKYLKKRGHARVSSLQDVLDILAPQALEVLLADATNHVPRTDFKSLPELAESLGCKEVWQTILLPVHVDDIVEAERVSNTSVEDVDRRLMLGSIITSCPGHLWTLCQLLDSKMDSLRCLHSDESVKFTKGIAEQMVSIGPCSVDLHGQNFTRITKLFRPAAHCLTSCRTFLTAFVLFRVVSRACLKVFGKPLVADCFVTDYSGSLRKGFALAQPQAPLLICYPHMFGCTDGRWKGRFNLSKRQVKMVQRHMSMLHSCRSQRAFQKQYSLVRAKWREADAGLLEFSKFFDRWYGPNSPCKGQWFVYGSDTIFVYPNNNPIEGYWRDIKGSVSHGIQSVVDVNVAPGRFVLEQLPKLMKHDCMHHCGTNPGHRLAALNDWVPIEAETLGVCALMTESTDCRWVGKNKLEAYLNKPWMVGHYPTTARIDQYKQTYNGTGQYSSPEDFAGKHNSLCHVLQCGPSLHSALFARCTIHFGVYCYCEVFKRNGMCAGAAFFMDLMGILFPCLNDRFSTTFNHRAGHVQVLLKKRRWVVVPKNPPWRAVYDRLGIDTANDEIPNAFVYLCERTARQKKKLRRLCGHYTPSDLYFPDGAPRRHLSQPESMEVLLAGTSLGMWLLNLIDASASSTSTTGHRFRELSERRVNERTTVTPFVSNPDDAFIIPSDPRDDSEDGSEDGSDDEDDGAAADGGVADQEETLDEEGYGDDDEGDDGDGDSSDSEDDDSVSNSGVARENYCVMPMVRPDDPSLTRSGVRDTMFDPHDPSSSIPYHLDTHQGRIPESTNCCLVISYLLIGCHLTQVGNLPNPLSVEGIREVIDVMTPAIVSSHSLRKPDGSIDDDLNRTLNAMMSGCFLTQFELPPHVLVSEHNFNLFEVATVDREHLNAPDHFVVDKLDSALREGFICGSGTDGGLDSSYQVAGAFFVGGHQFCILRGQPTNGIATDFHFHCIEGLPLPTEDPNYPYHGGVQLRDVGIRALWRFLKRRAGMAAPDDVVLKRRDGLQDSSVVLQIFRNDHEFHVKYRDGVNYGELLLEHDDLEGEGDDKVDYNSDGNNEVEVVEVVEEVGDEVEEEGADQVEQVNDVLPTLCRQSQVSIEDRLPNNLVPDGERSEDDDSCPIYMGASSMKYEVVEVEEDDEVGRACLINPLRDAARAREARVAAARQAKATRETAARELRDSARASARNARNTRDDITLEEPYEEPRDDDVLEPHEVDNAVLGEPHEDDVVVVIEDFDDDAEVHEAAVLVEPHDDVNAEDHDDDDHESILLADLGQQQQEQQQRLEGDQKLARQLFRQTNRLPDLPCELMREMMVWLLRYPMCPEQPWMDFAEEEDGRMEVSMFELFRQMEYTANLHSEVYSFIHRRGSQFDRRLFPMTRPYIPHRPPEPHRVMTVSEFRKFGSDRWFTENQIEAFLYRLAWLQVGETHPRTDFVVGNQTEARKTSGLPPRAPRPLFQRRLLPKSDSPKAYFVDIAWFQKIFGRNAYKSYNRGFSTTFDAMEAITDIYDSEGADLDLDEEENWRIRPHPNTHHRMGRIPGMRGSDGRSLSIMHPDRQYNPLDWEFITDEATYHSVVFTINIARQHWVTVVVDNNRHVIYYYDLLYTLRSVRAPGRLRRRRGRDETVVMDFQQTMRRIISHYLNQQRLKRPGLHTRPYQLVDVVEGERMQLDGVNCGPITCVISWLTAHLGRPPMLTDLKKVDFSVDGMRRFRNWVGYTYLTNRVWLPTIAEKLADVLKDHEYNNNPESENWDVLWNAPISEDNGDSVLLIP
jgi:hypothetical protein